MAKINFPYNLQNGKKSDADHVMANFNVLKDRLNSGLQADNLEEDSVTDDIIGNRTVNQDIADTSANTGKLTQLLSWIVKEIKAIKGTDDWKDSASSTLAAVYSALAQKVDKEAGKQLSTEDYTTEEKTKLSNIDAGANKYIHPATHSADIIVDGTTNKVFTAVEKTKLAGLFNYEHPATHPATMITEDPEHRFVTDAEKAAWSGKQDDLGFIPEDSANKGKANGYASLDSTGKIPSTQLPEIPEAGIKSINSIENAGGDIAIVGSTGITITTDDENKRVVVTATGEMTPGAHADSHGIGGSDPISPASIGAVAAVEGKGLSTEDFTTEEKTKLAGLSNYEHPATHPATMITEDSTHRFVTDSEKSSWDSAAAASHSHTNSAVLAKFSEEDGTLCYDGEAIGGGGETPANLTDTTLTLGGRFKIYYNSTTDSLDFEVLGV